MRLRMPPRFVGKCQSENASAKPGYTSSLPSRRPQSQNCQPKGTKSGQFIEVKVPKKEVLSQEMKSASIMSTAMSSLFGGANRSSFELNLPAGHSADEARATEGSARERPSRSVERND